MNVYPIGMPMNSNEYLQNAVGYRSPCVSLNQFQGNASPASQGGRSVREFEETLAALRKENFNLKLRLYFIEESIPGYQQLQNNGEGPEAIMKQLIDTKVESEVLRKELQEKQELLKDAAAAINLMDKKAQENETNSNALIEELKQKVQFLEMEKETERCGTNNDLTEQVLGRANLSDNMYTLQRVRELEGLYKAAEERVYYLQNEISKFNELLGKRDETIKELEEKVKEQAFQNAEISEQLEMKEQECSNAELKMVELRRKNSEIVDLKRELANAYETTKSDYQHELYHMNECQLKLRKQQDTLTKLRSTVSMKSEKTTQLLERLQEYDNKALKLKLAAKRTVQNDKHKLNSQQACIEKQESVSYEKKEIFHANGKLKTCTTKTSTSSIYKNEAVKPLESPLNKYFAFEDVDTREQDQEEQHEIKNYNLYRYINTRQPTFQAQSLLMCNKMQDYGSAGDGSFQAYVPIRYTLSNESRLCSSRYEGIGMGLRFETNSIKSNCSNKSTKVNYSSSNINSSNSSEDDNVQVKRNQPKVSETLGFKREFLLQPWISLRVKDIYKNALNFMIYCTIIVHVCYNLGSH